MKYKIIMLKKILIVFCLSQALIACYTSKPLEPRPDHWAISIDKNHNFYQVDKQLFRSERFKTDNSDLLKKHGVQTIINLRHQNTDNLSSQDFRLINYPLKTWAVTPEQLADILVLINNEQKQGKTVLIHCYHGADRTGIVIAMYRIIEQNWTIEQAKQEMLQGGYGFHKIWKNLSNLLTEQKVSEIRKLYLQQKNNQQVRAV